MKYLLFIVAALSGLALQAQNATINPALQKKYLPAGLKTLHIGMTVSELRKARPKVVMPKDEFDINCTEKFASGNIKEVTYQINTADSTVYEFIAEYRSTATATSIAKQMYTAPNFASTDFPLRWKYILDDGLVLVAWIFKNKICIANNAQIGF